MIQFLVVLLAVLWTIMQAATLYLVLRERARKNCRKHYGCSYSYGYGYGGHIDVQRTSSPDKPCFYRRD